MSSRWFWVMVSVLVTMLVVVGCGKPPEEGNTTTQPGPPIGRPGLPAVKPPAAPVKPGVAAPQPGPTTAAPAPVIPAPTPVSGDAYAQIGAARTGIHSYKVTMQQGPQKLTQYFKFQDGKPVRMRMDASPETWVLVQVDKKSAYAYDPAKKVAMKIATDKGPMAKQDLDDMTMLRKQNPKITSGTLDDWDCWIFSVSGKAPATIWIDKKQGLVRQIKQSEKIVKLKVEDVNGVADSQFELPAGVKVQDMSEMMKNMPNPHK